MIRYLKMVHPDADPFSDTIEDYLCFKPELLKDAIIFGGALRDITRFGVIHGDIDILCKRSDFNELSRIITNEGWGLYTPQNNPYTANSGVEFKISFFKNGDGNVQLIAPIRTGKSIPETVCVNHVRSVDFRCCGLLQTVCGPVFETIPGAFQDCKYGILELNKAHKLNVKNIAKRTQKLVRRGWTMSEELKRLLKAEINNNRKKIESFFPQAYKTEKISPTDDIYDVENRIRKYYSGEFINNITTGSSAKATVDTVCSEENIVNIKVAEGGYGVQDVDQDVWQLHYFDNALKTESS